MVWNDNNQDIKIANNYFVFKPKLKKENVLINAVDSLGDEEEYKIAFSGPMTNGITYSNNKYFRDNTLPSYNECLEKMGLDYLSRYKVTLIETNEETYLGNILKTAAVVQVKQTNNATIVYWFKLSVIISAVVLVTAVGIFAFALIQRKRRASK